MINCKRSILPLTLLSGALLLSGCQSLPVRSPPPPAAENIATHEFQLSEGQNMVGTIAAVNTQENDALPDIARHFGLGYNDISHR